MHRDANTLAAVSGSFAPRTESPATELCALLNDASSLDKLDGTFAAACWDGDRRRLTLIRDPFGVRSLYYIEHAGVFYFASELKQLLAIPGLPVELDPVALHKYLTFSFVPGEDVPVRGIQRLLPGRVAVWENGKLDDHAVLHAARADRPGARGPEDRREAGPRAVPEGGREAAATASKKSACILSGGLDSSGVACWLKQAGVNVRAFSLDFGRTASRRSRRRSWRTSSASPLIVRQGRR